ncbi:MAG: phosphoenolpyruvate--protein phosphotransferase [Ruminiclostridium sp.]|nr:phosphoenolpyruvate--protein phosphotransferase [Ruminiclostridium sp.]
MLRFIGKGVYPAVAIGRISVTKKSTAISQIQPSDKKTDNYSDELKRFEKAKETAVGQLKRIYEKAVSETGEEAAGIFDIHMMLIEDEDFNEAVLGMLEEGYNAEYSVANAGRIFSDSFAAMDDDYMKERSADIRDISDRILSCLSGNENSNEADGDNLIICADDLTPSETMSIDRSRVVAFVTAYGSANSHTAILARSMGIPAIIGMGEDFISQLSEGDSAVVDGETGELIIVPDEKTLEAFIKKQNRQKAEKALIEENRGKENITLDGRRIDIFANIGSIDNVKSAIENDAGGIGLFRSEFIYLDRDSYPSEEEQFNIYKKVLSMMENKKVVIRTLDIGADKNAEYFDIPKEENPALGLRAIRLCLARPEIFETQLRALFRASVYGNLAVMFPMISSENELIRVREICDKVKNQLKAENIPYDENTEIGIMVETPAAAVISDKLAKLCDFFSIGTNDLTQYTTACDRQNPYLDKYSDTENTAVLRLIEYTAKSAHENGIWVGICGELAADTSLTEKFINIGIDELSVTPSFILKVRDKVRRTKKEG